ncbi:MAG: glycosyltransferase, partial [Thermoplasmatota archaeon]
MARPFVTFTYWELALIAAGALLGLAVARSRWRGVGLLSYVGLVALVVGYVWYSLMVSIPRVPPNERWLSYILLTAEAGGLTLVVMSSLYSLDVAARRLWGRHSTNRAHDPKYRPVVAFLVPVYNEPLSMVEQTIAHLARQDYPRDKFAIVVADDTSDAAARAKTAEACARLGAWYVTRKDRRGFKAGALNAAMTTLAPEVEFVAVVDADYWAAPNFLTSIMGYFIDKKLAFVQTPQAYRNGDESFLTRQYARSEAYFYQAMMPSRNEENAIIFCGTMGVLRRRALEGVGGFAEDQICEDAEVSVRLAIAGWDSLYVSRSFGRGLMPAVFDAYKKQFNRWSFGNVRILWTHLLPILRSSMSARQKFDFISASLHWFDGIFTLTIALVLLDVGLAPLLGVAVVTHHQREIVLLAL